MTSPRPRASEPVLLAPLRAEEIAARHFGLQARAEPLPGYADENFRLATGDGTKFVLKVAASEPDLLELQNDALDHLERAGVAAPRVVRDRNGRALVPVEIAGGLRLVRVLSWLEGRPLAEVEHPPRELFSDLGRFLARLDGCLASFEHPAAERSLDWDLLQADRARELLPAIGPRRQRARVASILGRFEEVLPDFRACPRQVVHNDANDYNVLVHTEAGRPTIRGLIDFGDLAHTARVAEPAIAMTYAMLGDEPLPRAGALLAGYQLELPLEERELEMLPLLIETRLAVSVSKSAFERVRAPENAYISVTEPHAWRLLGWLAERGEGEVAAALGDAVADTGGRT